MGKRPLVPGSARSWKALGAAALALLGLAAANRASQAQGGFWGFAHPHGPAGGSGNVAIQGLGPRAPRLAPRTPARPAPPRATQGGETFQNGDVFVGVSRGLVEWHRPDGTLVKILDTGLGGETTGMAFDKAGNLYVTLFQANTTVVFDPTGTKIGTFGTGYNIHPESIVFDAAGNAYVGQADGTQDVLKFAPDGSLLQSFNVPTERRGSDHIDLAADQRTLFYTSEGRQVLRYDVATDSPLPLFATLPSGGVAFAIRILPDGNVLVGDLDAIRLLDSGGNVIRTFDAPNENNWFATNVDPDGLSFWSVGFTSGIVYRFDLATGSVIHQFPVVTQNRTSVAGLVVKGEKRAAVPQGAAFKSAPSTVVSGQPATFVAQSQNDQGQPESGKRLIFEVIESTTGDLGFRQVRTTDQSGQAAFVFTPRFPGTNRVRVTLDKNLNNVANDDEPSDLRVLSSTPPPSTPGAVISGSGSVGRVACPGVFSMNVSVPTEEGSSPTGEVTFSITGRNFQARSSRIDAVSVEFQSPPPTGQKQGRQPRARGPRAATEPSSLAATILGVATINGSGSVPFRIDVRDAGTGRSDKFEIRFLSDIDRDGSPEVQVQGGSLLSGNVSVGIQGPPTGE